MSDYEYAEMFINYKYFKQPLDTIAWDIINRFE